MICRNLRPEDRLPWPAAELGWKVEQLDLDTAWVAEDDGAIVGLILGAEVHHTLLLLRILGAGGWWLRPLWRVVESACLQRLIAGWWMIYDNTSVHEKKLAGLLELEASEGGMQEFNGTWIVGKWRGQDAGISSDSLVSTFVDRSGGRGDDRNNGVRTYTGRRWRRRVDVSPTEVVAAAAAGSPAAAAESGFPGEPGQYAGGDGRELDPDRIRGVDSAQRGFAIRSQLFAAVFGTGRRDGGNGSECFGGSEPAEYQHAGSGIE